MLITGYYVFRTMDVSLISIGKLRRHPAFENHLIEQFNIKTTIELILEKGYMF